MTETNNKFAKWLDNEITQLEKQTKRWHCGNTFIYCLCEFVTKTALEQKLTHYKEIKEKYKELRENDRRKD